MNFFSFIASKKALSCESQSSCKVPKTSSSRKRWYLRPSQTNKNYLLWIQFIHFLTSTCLAHDSIWFWNCYSIPLFTNHQTRDPFWHFLNSNNAKRKVKSIRKLGLTYSLSPSLTWVPPYSGRRTVSPSLTETGINFPSLSLEPGPTAITLPEFNCNQPETLFRSYKCQIKKDQIVKKKMMKGVTEEAFSGRRMPLSVLAGWMTLCTRMRLNVGTRRFIISQSVVSANSRVLWVFYWGRRNVLGRRV